MPKILAKYGNFHDKLRQEKRRVLIEVIVKTTDGIPTGRYSGPYTQKQRLTWGTDYMYLFTHSGWFRVA